MNQYIITENLLDRLYDAGYSRGCMERDEEHNKKLGVIYKEAESHPYNPQAEREKVLDKILNHILDDMGVEIHERDGKKYFVISGTFSVSELILYLQSLRQSKEGRDDI